MNFPELCSFYLWLGTIPWFQYTLWIPPASFHLFSLNVILISIHRLFILKNPLEGDEVCNRRKGELKIFQKFRPFLRPAHVAIPIVSFLLTGYSPFQHPKIIESVRGNETIAEWYMDEVSGRKDRNSTTVSIHFTSYTLSATVEPFWSSSHLWPACSHYESYSEHY